MTSGLDAQPESAPKDEQILRRWAQFTHADIVARRTDA